MQMSTFPTPPPAGKALPGQSIQHLTAPPTTALGVPASEPQQMMLPQSPDTAQPAHPHLHAGKGKLAHGQVKQQDVFLASFFISRTQTQW